MLRIRQLDNATPEYMKSVAQLHKRAFPSFFLTQLGLPLLKELYSFYIEDSLSGIIVAENNNRLIGFLAYSNDYPRFYKELIKKHLIKFSLCSLGAALRHPSFIRRLLGTFKKSDSVTKSEKYVELASICVDPSQQEQGIGTALINYLKGLVDFTTYAYINLETDAENNEEVNKFYVKNGFKLVRSFVTSEGRKMNEYRYIQGDKNASIVP